MKVGVMFCHTEHRQVRLGRDHQKHEYYASPPHKVTVRTGQNNPRCPVCGGPLCDRPLSLKLVKKAT